MEKNTTKKKKQEKNTKKIGQITQQQDFSRGWLTQILKFNGLKPLQGTQKHGCHANGVKSFVKTRHVLSFRSIIDYRSQEEEK